MLSFDGRLIGLKRFCTWLLDQDMNCELEGQFFQLSQNVSWIILCMIIYTSIM